MLAGALLLPLPALAQTPNIQIEGVGGALRDNIRAHLRIGDERCTSSIRRLNRLIPQIERSTERALQALGYYLSDIEISFSEGEACWQLQISINAGEPVTINELQISIVGDDSVFRPVLDSPPITRGAQLNHSQYERLKSLLSAVAVENGYFNARFNRSDLAIDLVRNTADVIIEFDTGSRHQFGEIRIAPIEALSERFIYRFVPFEEGTPYSSEQLVQLRQNLNDSQYFRQVSVTPLLTEADEGIVPLSVELEPRLRRSYTTGVGASTNAGPRVRFAYEDRYINRQGHRLTGDVLISQQQQEPSLSYIIPLRNPAIESLRLSGGFMRQETDSYTTNTWRMGVAYRSNFPTNWVQTVFTNYQQERAQLSSEKVQTNSMISGINWSRTRADDPIYPRRGWRLFAQVSGAREEVFSDISFTQLYSSAKWIESFGPGRLLLRGEMATTFVSEVQELPISERFFTGGDTTVRGYQWSSLGATNASGEVVGGKNLLVGSIEYDFPIRGSWNGAVFADTGNSFADFGNFKLNRSAGLGIRWLSPIGAIRFDLARGLDDGNFRFHLTMGPDL